MSARAESAARPGIGHRVGEVSESARALVTDVQDAVDQAVDTLDVAGRMKRNPYAVLGVAAGIGFLWGGGLFNRLAVLALKVGLPLGVAMFANDRLFGKKEG
jgi:hypothetical protein